MRKICIQAENILSLIHSLNLSEDDLRIPKGCCYCFHPNSIFKEGESYNSFPSVCLFVEQLVVHLLVGFPNLLAPDIQMQVSWEPDYILVEGGFFVFLCIGSPCYILVEGGKLKLRIGLVLILQLPWIEGSYGSPNPAKRKNGNHY